MNSSPKLKLWDVLILILSVYVLVAMALLSAFNHDPQVVLLFERFDFIVCLFFLADFVFRFYKADNKIKFMQWGWIDLLASIPALDAFRWGRLLRITRVLRLFRAFRSVREISLFLMQQRTKSVLVATLLLLLFSAFSGAVLILDFEADSTSNIKTADTALWWAVVTMTTVGYGDYVPVTGAGRILAGVMMLIGVCLIGAISGTFATWFMSEHKQQKEADLIRIQQDLDLIKRKLNIEN